MSWAKDTRREEIASDLAHTNVYVNERNVASGIQTSFVCVSYLAGELIWASQ